jgi:hypothetical protein
LDDLLIGKKDHRGSRISTNVIGRCVVALF